MDQSFFIQSIKEYFGCLHDLATVIVLWWTWRCMYLCGPAQFTFVFQWQGSGGGREFLCGAVPPIAPPNVPVSCSLSWTRLCNSHTSTPLPRLFPQYGSAFPFILCQMICCWLWTQRKVSFIDEILLDPPTTRTIYTHLCGLQYFLPVFSMAFKIVHLLL